MTKCPLHPAQSLHPPGLGSFRASRCSSGWFRRLGASRWCQLRLGSPPGEPTAATSCQARRAAVPDLSASSINPPSMYFEPSNRGVMSCKSADHQSGLSSLLAPRCAQQSSRPPDQSAEISVREGTTGPIRRASLIYESSCGATRPPSSMNAIFSAAPPLSHPSGLRSTARFLRRRRTPATGRLARECLGRLGSALQPAESTTTLLTAAGKAPTSSAYSRANHRVAEQGRA